jgi:glutamine synthetase
MNNNEITDKIKNLPGGKIKYAVSDIDGILRTKYIHRNKFLDSAERGIGFCDVVFGWDMNDSCYDNTKITGWHTGYPDAKAKIDLTTFREIPWENNTLFFIADFSGDAVYEKAACPRSLLRRVKNECELLGFKAVFAQEFEWFNFAGTPSSLSADNFQNLKPITPGMFGYSALRTSLNQSYIDDLFNMLGKFDVPLEGIHTETGPGVYEATIIYDDILAAADKAFLFKNSVKEISYLHNFVATFMAKWNTKLPGCGGHIHQSLWDREENTNLFYNGNNNKGLTELTEQYIAGQLACLPEILPMYAPNVNSYKRIGHGDWAPANISWGIDNRTASVRVIPGCEKSARTELRVPGADMNPYLAMAAALASGIYGIKNKLKLTAPETIGNAYNQKECGILSGNLKVATQKMAESKIAQELFGAGFVDHFVRTREWEWRLFENEVTDWELKRYLEII